MPRPRRRSRPPELAPEPFADACCPAEVADRADLLLADPLFCGFFCGGCPAGGFVVRVPTGTHTAELRF